MMVRDSGLLYLGHPVYTMPLLCRFHVIVLLTNKFHVTFTLMATSREENMPSCDDFAAFQVQFLDMLVVYCMDMQQR